METKVDRDPTTGKEVSYVNDKSACVELVRRQAEEIASLRFALKSRLEAKRVKRLARHSAAPVCRVVDNFTSTLIRVGKTAGRNLKPLRERFIELESRQPTTEDLRRLGRHYRAAEGGRTAIDDDSSSSQTDIYSQRDTVVVINSIDFDNSDVSTDSE